MGASVKASSKPKRSATAFRASTATLTTSGPIPSPGMVAMLYFVIRLS